MLKIMSRILAAIAIIGYVHVGYRTLPMLWEQVGGLITISVGLSLTMMIIIFLHDVLFGRSIFEVRK